jgi:EmrB/QacA subfamily drug resistance transporter
MSTPPVPRRWVALVFIALAQLMVVLDATVVNIALPSAQRALGISDGDRQWVITAYTLAFGGLLLFGGRVGDLVGRRRAFLVGLVGFAAASALGGASRSEAMLLAARATQGAFGALLAPSALSLLAVAFPAGRERARAFGVYGAIAGGGAAIGLILGGVLTEYLNWRWALYVNVPIAVVGLLGGLAFVRDPAPPRGGSRADVPGAVLVTAGLVALVYGVTRAEAHGWSDRGVTVVFSAAAVLLLAFVTVEAMSREPLLPLPVVLDRNRGGAYLAVGLSVVGMFGLFLFLTYYLQVVRRYSPVEAGLAFLPMTAAMITGSTQIAARLMNRVPPRALMAPGLLVAASGVVLLTRIHVDTAYIALVLPAQVLLGLGLGSALMPAMNLATAGVDPSHAGVASALVNTSQQVGGSIGTALLNTIATAATSRYVAAHPRAPRLAATGLVHGFTVALWWAVGVLVLAALAAMALINRRGETGRPAAEPVAAEVAPARELVTVGAVAGEPSPAPRRTAPMAAFGGGSGGSVGGRVRSGDGGSLAGAALTLIDPGGHQVGRGFAAADGSYAMAVPGPGAYMLVAAADGYQPQVATVTVGDDPVRYDLTLPGTCGLAGIVRGAATEAPIAGAMVVVTDADGELVGSAETGADGAFAFGDLVAGAYVVAVTAGGHRPAALPVEVTGPGVTRCDVELPVGARVRGIVRSAADGLPLADARVTLVDAGGNVVGSVTSGPDGAYAFDGLVPGPYTLIASGYPPAAATLTVNGTGECEFGLTLGHE